VARGDGQEAICLDDADRGAWIAVLTQVKYASAGCNAGGLFNAGDATVEWHFPRAECSAEETMAHSNFSGQG